MMKKATHFPDLSAMHSGAFTNNSPGEVFLDGMPVIFDKKVRATPVSLDYKKKRKIIEKTR